MNNNDCNLEELLAQLQKHPELIRELTFNPETIPALLAANGISAPTKDFLNYMAQPTDGFPVAQCLYQTHQLCAKGTRQAACGGGTKNY